MIGDVKDSLTDTLLGRVPADAPDPLVEFKPTYASKVLWQAKLGPAQYFDFVPVLDAGFVYAASSNGEIVKLDALSGKQEWRVNSGEVLSGGVGVGVGGAGWPVASWPSMVKRVKCPMLAIMELASGFTSLASSIHLLVLVSHQAIAMSASDMPWGILAGL